MSSLLKTKTEKRQPRFLQESSCLEALEMRRYLSGLAPVVPQNETATYEVGYTTFRWRDSGSLVNEHDPSVAYVIETSPNGDNNWTSLPSIDADAAAPNGFQNPDRRWKYRHERQKFYRIHAVDAEGDVSLPTSVFQVNSHPEDFAIEASAAVQPSGAIALAWGAKTGYSYNISRRDLGSTGPFTLKAAVSPTGTTGTYTDNVAVSGSGYEYSITSAGLPTSYLISGRNVAPIENRGKLVLLVDDSVAGTLRGFIARLQSDLVGDGWTVLRHNVSRNQSVETVKQIIKNDYVNKSEVKQVLLLGHVPVPLSGDRAPDGHDTPNGDYDHYGAWAADAYYGDMDGVWTDNTVNTEVASTGRVTGKFAARNTPDDKKFDQNS